MMFQSMKHSSSVCWSFVNDCMCMLRYNVFPIPVNATFLEKATNAIDVSFYGCPLDDAFAFVSQKVTWFSDIDVNEIFPFTYGPFIAIFSDSKLTYPRLKIKVGAGTVIQHIMLCLHYHATTGALTERTTLSLELEPVSLHPEIKILRKYPFQVESYIRDPERRKHPSYCCEDSLTRKEIGSRSTGTVAHQQQSNHSGTHSESNHLA